jgi:hypothetical protein
LVPSAAILAEVARRPLSRVEPVAGAMIVMLVSSPRRHRHNLKERIASGVRIERSSPRALRRTRPVCPIDLA